MRYLLRSAVPSGDVKTNPVAGSRLSVKVFPDRNCADVEVDVVPAQGEDITLASIERSIDLAYRRRVGINRRQRDFSADYTDWRPSARSY